MGIETAGLIFMAASAASAAYGAYSQSQAQKDAKRSAEQQQAQLDALKREEAPTMPDPDAQARARRRSITAQMGRRGRASTILTGGTGTGDTLGG